MKEIAVVLIILYLGINGLITICDFILMVLVMGVIVFPLVVGLDYLLELIYIMLLEEMWLFSFIDSLLFHVELVEVTLANDCSILVIDNLVLIVIYENPTIIVLVQELLWVMMHALVLWVEVYGSLEVGLVLVNIFNDHVVIGMSLVVSLDWRAACVALVLYVVINRIEW